MGGYRYGFISILIIVVISLVSVRFGQSRQANNPKLSTNRNTGSNQNKGNSKVILKWKFKAKGAVYPSISTNGTIYVGSEDSSLYAISSDGNLKWQYQTDEIIV